MKNPSIKELQNPEKFEVIAELSHNEIKEFVINQISAGGKIVKWYMIYQFAMVITGIFFLTRTIVMAFKNDFVPLIYAIAALFFCFTLLIIIHELLHGIAIKLTGAQKVNYGAYFKRFIFYAEADRHVINRRQFALIALTPLFVIQILTFTAAILFWQIPAFYFIMIVMTSHSLFCAGDIALLSIFYQNGSEEIFTFDVKAEKKSYYFRRLQSQVNQ